jgi:hypothetical protein
MRHSVSLIASALIAVAALSGCARKSGESASSSQSDSVVVSNPTERAFGELTPQAPAPEPSPPAARPKAAPKPRPAAAPEQAARRPAGPPVNVRWGTLLWVRFTDEISSETAKRGDSWSGTLRDSVVVDQQVAFPAGSVVHGTVVDVTPAQKGDRAVLGLEVTSIEAYDRSWAVSAKTDPLVAESPRARNIGGIAGGAAAGALIGGAVGGEKGALIGGVVGGGAAGSAVARSKGYQAVVKPGTTLRFRTTWDMTVRP